MRLKSALAGVLLALPAAGMAAPCTDGAAPRFEDYPAQQVEVAQRASLRLNNAFARRYRTALQEGLRDFPIEFAGHYVVVTPGCGTTCMFGGWVDALTGQAFGLPGILDTFGPFGIDDPLLFRADSRLVITLGAAASDESRPEARYYEWTGRKLKPLCSRILTLEEAQSLGRAPQEEEQD